MSYKIIDNFLPEDIFNPLFDLMSSYHFPWYFNEFVADEDSPLDNFQFTHTFFNTSIDVVHTPYHNFISPIIDRLDVKKLERVKDSTAFSSFGSSSLKPSSICFKISSSFLFKPI